MSNANVEFKVERDAKLAIDVLTVVADKIPVYSNGTGKKIDTKIFETIIEQTIAQTSPTVKIFPKIDVKKQKKPPTVDFTVAGTTAAIETTITQNFVDKIKQITGDTRSVADLTRDIQKAFVKNLRKPLGFTAKNKELQIVDNTDYNPDNLQRGSELEDLRDTIDTQIGNPLALVDYFKNALAGDLPLFRKPLLPGFKTEIVTGTTTIPESTLAGTFAGKPDDTVKLLDKRISEFLEMSIYKLTQLKTAGTITEDQLNERIAQIILSVNEFRNNFLAGTPFADPEKYKPLSDSTNGSIQELFSAITKSSDKAVTDLVDLTSALNPTTDQIKKFRAVVSRRDDSKITDTNESITSKDWATPINIKKIKEAADRLSNSVPTTPLTAPISSNVNLLTEDKIERGVVKAMKKLIDETPAAITDPTERKLDLVKRTLELINEMQSGNQNNVQENAFDTKLKEKLQEEVLTTLSTLGRFEDYFNPLSPSFNIARFGPNFHGGTNSYRIFQDVLQKLNQFTKHSEPIVAQYFKELNDKLRNAITNPNGPISTRLNDLQRKKTSTGINASEEIELNGLIDSQKLVGIIDDRSTAPVGLDAKRDFTNSELTKTLNQFATEFTKVSAQREKELKAEIEKTNRDLRAAQKVKATTVEEEMKAKSTALNNELEEVKAAPDAMKDMMRNAKDIVSKLYSAQANVEKARGSTEKTAIRFKRMELMRNRAMQSLRTVPQAVVSGAVAGGITAATMLPMVGTVGGLTSVGNVRDYDYPIPVLGRFNRNHSRAWLPSLDVRVPGVAALNSVVPFGRDPVTSAIARVAGGTLLGVGIYKAIDKLTGGDARRYARETLAKEKINEAEKLKQEVEMQIDEQEVIIDNALENLTMLARTFRQYNNISGRFTTQEKYRYLKDSWKLYYPDDQQQLTEIVSQTSEKLLESHGALQSRLDGAKLGANREGKARVNELREEYRNKHAGRVNWYNNVVRRGRGTGPSVASAVGTVTAPGWGILGRLKNIFA